MSPALRTWAAEDPCGTWNFRQYFAKIDAQYARAVSHFAFLFFWFFFRRLSSLWHEVWSLLVTTFASFLLLLWKVIWGKSCSCVFISIRAYYVQCTEAKHESVELYFIASSWILLISGTMCLPKTSQNSSFSLSLHFCILCGVLQGFNSVLKLIFRFQ